jgi:hypothetical protein
MDQWESPRTQTSLPRDVPFVSGPIFRGLGGAILDEEYQLNKSSAYNHWHAAARIIPGKVPEREKFHVGNGRNLPNGQRRSRRHLFNGPRYGCDYPVRPGVDVEFCPSGAGRGPPAPPRLCAAGTDVLIAARVRLRPGCARQRAVASPIWWFADCRYCTPPGQSCAAR